MHVGVLQSKHALSLKHAMCSQKQLHIVSTTFITKGLLGGTNELTGLPWDVGYGSLRHMHAVERAEWLSRFSGCDYIDQRMHSTYLRHLENKVTAVQSD